MQAEKQRDLQRIVGVCQSRGAIAVIDGDSVAVLTRRRHRVAEGVPSVNYQVRRVRTVTEAYIEV